MRKLIHPIKDNSLTIVLFMISVICITGQSFAGWLLQNETLASHGQVPISYWFFLTTGSFLDGLACNWQAAVLLLTSLIVLSRFLYQRGAPHSRNPKKPKLKHGRHNSSHFSWFYRYSFSLAFLLLFVLCFALHIFFGARAYNEELLLLSQPTISIAAFLLSAKFWTTTLQTWQAGYLAITFYLVFSIFLRQEGSPESKAVESKTETTGSSNK